MRRRDIWDAAGPLRPAFEQVDWAASAVGPVSGWSDALADAVDIALHTQFPATLLWGPEFVLIYNAPYAELIADKHPAALGQRARDIFPEAWAQVGPLMERVLAGRGATWIEDAPLPLMRHGRLQEAYFTYSYSPVRGRDGTIEGVLDIAVETTRQVVDRRRLAMLSRLRDALDEAERVDQVPGLATEALRSNEQDFASVEIVLAGAHARDDVLSFPLGEGGRWQLLVPRSRALVEEELFTSFVRLLVSMISRALVRLGAREDEHAIAEALQRSLLSPPPQSDHLQVAVRYRPAAPAKQVGGDWYDGFLGPRRRHWRWSSATSSGTTSGRCGQDGPDPQRLARLLRPVGEPRRQVLTRDDRVQGQPRSATLATAMRGPGRAGPARAGRRQGRGRCAGPTPGTPRRCGRRRRQLELLDHARGAAARTVTPGAAHRSLERHWTPGRPSSSAPTAWWRTGRTGIDEGCSAAVRARSPASCAARAPSLRRAPVRHLVRRPRR